MKTEESIKESGLIEAIQCIIDTTSDPLKEYELISILNQQGWDLSTSATDTLTLFTSHFLVFNALFRLQTGYWQNQNRFLEISALRIYLHPKVENAVLNRELSTYMADAKLRDYYLDINQLEVATEESVNKLLNQFWEQYIASDESSEALHIFSLTHPASYKDIKTTYRKLAMEHHPDRGGEPETFLKINWAFGVLQRVYK